MPSSSPLKGSRNLNPIRIHIKILVTHFFKSQLIRIEVTILNRTKYYFAMKLYNIIGNSFKTTYSGRNKTIKKDFKITYKYHKAC